MTSVSYVECDVPEGMTLRQWRRSRVTARRPSRRLRRAITGIRGSAVKTA